MTVRKKSKTIPVKSIGRDEKLQELRLAIQEGIDSGVIKRSFSEILKEVEERLQPELNKGENA